MFFPLSSLGLVMRSLLPFPLFLCPPLRTGYFPEALHQACSEVSRSTRAGCWHSAVPAAQGPALRPPPASRGCSPPTLGSCPPLLAAWPGGQGVCVPISMCGHSRTEMHFPCCQRLGRAQGAASPPALRCPCRPGLPNLGGGGHRAGGCLPGRSLLAPAPPPTLPISPWKLLLSIF